MKTTILFLLSIMLIAPAMARDDHDGGHDNYSGSHYGDGYRNYERGDHYDHDRWVDHGGSYLTPRYKYWGHTEQRYCGNGYSCKDHNR